MTYTKTIKALTTVSAIAIFAVSGANDAYAQSAFTWGHGGQTAETDRALEQAQVQIKYDGINAVTQLNISANNGAVVASRQDRVNFQSFWNYSHFIEKAEVRIFSVEQSVHDDNVLILPMKDGKVSIPANADLPDEMIYVLRVYDKNGRYDQTEAKLLSMIDGPAPKAISTLTGEKLVGYGIDRTSIKSISVKGGSVTVYGQDVAPGGTVSLSGQSVPVDSQGKFAVQQILPYGEHKVSVVLDENGQRTVFDRDIELDGTEFFYVSIGDLTLGTEGSLGPANFLGGSDNDFGDVRLNGRGASYLKGRINGEYLVTAAIDTTEERLGDVLSNLDEKDPDQLLRRLDADRFIPVYGDDSTLVEDAPTQGRFFVRVEKDDSHIMWGNFVTQITTTEFAHLDRGLYGGILDYNSEATTSHGERKTQVTTFVADPGTVPAREEYRGTGGSVYFLERQDLSIGSERVRIEIRDKVSGLVLETRNLTPQEDYDVDYIQGRILLTDPLQSTSTDNQIVRDGALSGNDVFLVVRYEFSPSISDVDGFTVGGRATHWLGDNVRVGVTGQNEKTEDADQTLLGVDALVRYSDGTYIKAEYAQTEGNAFGQSNSTDGGFTFENIADQGQDGLTAQAYRVEAAVDLEDFTHVDGRISGYYEDQENGFSGSNNLIAGDVERYGIALAADLTDNTSFDIKYDEVDTSLRGGTRAVYADINHEITDLLTVSAGVRYDLRNLANSVNVEEVDGSRTDASVQAAYKVNDRVDLHAFGQVTLDRDDTRSRNNRAGVGGDFLINERLTLSGEVSEGDGGFGANAQATFRRSDNSEYYLGYALSADRTDTGFATDSQFLSDTGTLTLGAKTRFNDSLSVYGEERIGFGQQQSSLTHVFGLDFNPSERWSFGAAFENGEIDDNVNGTFDRTAFSVSAAVADDNVRASTSLEARFEDGVSAGTNRDRTTWLSRTTLAVDVDEDWELLGRLNFAISDSDESDFLDADFVEGVIGAAYRPVNNDRLNGLLKYTYFEDLVPSDQISSNGLTNLTRQTSEIFSIDAIYDVTKKLSIGGKYGFRSGEVELTRGSDDFVSSDAHLGVVRLDYHVLKKWDLLAEGRVLRSSLADDRQFGALIGAYRHVGENAKLGVGYNFARFSDDLTDFDDNSDGFFVNLVGKF